ncbi:DUF2321 domain-containing protein [Aeromonas caviae]|uniref:DUF2321 domain-containing protein n=1 Tax=Aeromonas caviae TaxID=648 RepID=UPI0038D00F28
MGYYDVQQVCLKGHQITDRYNYSTQNRKRFCSECGSETIHQCPACQSPIPGDYHSDGLMVIGFSTPIPSHCDNCGEAFPWTKDKTLLNEPFSREGANKRGNSSRLTQSFHFFSLSRSFLP